MLEKRTPLQINQAVEKIMEQVIVGKTEVISINDCDQRYLGEDTLAKHDVPLFTRSGFDGYALRSVVMSLAQSDSFVVLPGRDSGFKKGDQVQVLLLDE